MSMDIYAKSGHRVIVSKQTAHNGYDSDKGDVEKHLEIGKIYNIHSTNVSQSSTSIVLQQFPDKNWNSVNFINYVSAPKEDDFKEMVEIPNQTNHVENLVNKEAYEFALRKWKRECADQIEARAMYKEGILKLGQTEMMVTNISAYDKSCNGCLRHKKFAMVAYQKEGSTTIFDLFLNEEEANRLYTELGKIVNI